MVRLTLDIENVPYRAMSKFAIKALLSIVLLLFSKPNPNPNPTPTLLFQNPESHLNLIREATLQ